MTQASAYEACSCMCMPQHMHKMLDVLKKACLVWLKKGQGVWQIARLKQRFLSFFYYIAQRSYKKIVYLFVIWLVQWWKLYCIYILFTQRTIDFHRLKRNINDGTIVFLTSLLVALTWNILLLFFSEKG